MNLTPLAVATAALATGAALVAGPASATAPTATASTTSHTLVISSCQKATYRPKQYVLTCADANTQIHHAVYATWTATAAAGHGTFVYNTCHPNCAAGTFKHHPVQFTLGRVRTVGGKKLFTRLSVSYAGLYETFQLPTKTG
jgi:hypothetical protein